MNEETTATLIAASIFFSGLFMGVVIVIAAIAIKEAKKFKSDFGKYKSPENPNPAEFIKHKSSWN